MAYIEPKDAVHYLLNTGDRSVLAKTDPARRTELNQELKLARTKIQMKLETAPADNEYARLLKAQKAKQARQQNPLMKGVEAWPSGNSYLDQLGIKVKYVPLKSRED